MTAPELGGWQGPPVHVVGMACHQQGLLPEGARQALSAADYILGARRHLETLRGALDLGAACRWEELPQPFQRLLERLRRYEGRRIVLLASGDPLLYGAGSWLLGQLERRALVFHSNVSSVQAACARAGIPWEKLEIISLHGRPLEGLRARLRQGRYYALLTDAGSSPKAVARELRAAGYGEGRLWAAEDLGTPRERVREYSVAQLCSSRARFSAQLVLLVHNRGRGAVLPEFPGFADEHFAGGGTDGGGMLSKREVRLAILSLLSPRAGDLAWDVGAGCGSVAVEWARWNPQGCIYAVERAAQRRALLEANRARFGVAANLHLVAGEAPAALEALPPPEGVFVGGGGARLGEILEYCWQRLQPGGRLVASAVTEDSRAVLCAFGAERGGTASRWTEIAVSRGEQLGRALLLRPRLPVLLLSVTKSTAGSGEQRA